MGQYGFGGHFHKLRTDSLLIVTCSNPPILKNSNSEETINKLNDYYELGMVLGALSALSI